MASTATKARNQGRPDNRTFLTTAPVGKVISTMAVPTVVSMLVTSIYNIADTYFVGLINTQATAAVGIVFPVMSIIQAIGFFFGQGSGTYISRKLGADEKHDADLMASTAFFSALASGLMVTLLGLAWLRPLSRALGSTPTILPYTIDYLGVILLGAPLMTCSMVLNNQMRFQGNAGKAMFGMLAGAGMNLILVPLFIFGFKMGILGCAIGTVLAQAFGFFTLLAMSRSKENISIKAKSFSTHRIYYREILRGGTPSLTRQVLACISTILLNVAAGAYGDAAIAGMSIVGRLSFVIFATILGIGQGFQPFCGFNYGAGNYDRVRKGIFYSIKLSLSFLALLCIPCFIFSPEIIYLLRHDPQVVAVGSTAFRWQLCTYPLAAIIVVSTMALQTSGRALMANILSASRNGLFFIPLILILPRIFGLLGVEMCQAVADLFSFLATIPIMYRYLESIRQR